MAKGLVPLQNHKWVGAQASGCTLWEPPHGNPPAAELALGVAGLSLFLKSNARDV